MGRLQKFDEDLVIARAQSVFWEKGYQETRLDDLLQATGLHKGSFYRSFKSKESLFLRTLNAYGSVARSFYIQTEDPVDYLLGFFSAITEDCVKDSRGCLVFNTCMELGAGRGILAKAAKNYYEEMKANFSKVVDLAKVNGQIDENTDGDELVTRLVGAAFSIKELSKFQSDRKVFADLANGVLKEFGAAI